MPRETKFQPGLDILYTVAGSLQTISLNYMKSVDGDWIVATFPILSIIIWKGSQKKTSVSVMSCYFGKCGWNSSSKLRSRDKYSFERC